ncbi:hypothetical protein EYC84_010373 [Monilinia fructicola]|uniref:Uncharacterized protein n=1 Tax=Monilinia fructicola TaxID=38448 RepID=A0A5M9JG97_MONFR|nr:hypothetical protein EYC84_010373 [Monilinia fructicola]
MIMCIIHHPLSLFLFLARVSFLISIGVYGSCFSRFYITLYSSDILITVEGMINDQDEIGKCWLFGLN